MMGEDALTTYWSCVPSIGFICGAPSIFTGCGFVSETLTAAVCGIEFATAASCACWVPGTDALTFSMGLSSGIAAKSFGRASNGTQVHGPSGPGAENHRPERLT
jgi:hypothetical protein